MKHKLLKLLPLLLLGGVIGLAASPAAFEVASVEAATSVSFTKSDFTGGKSGGGKPINASKDGVKITGSSGYLPSADEFRIYGDANLTITSTDYEISEIHFTFNSKTGGFDSTYTSINSKEWSKKATSQAVFTSIEITFNTSSFFIESISADISDAKTTYAQGSNLDLSGVKINGLKNSGGTVDLTSQCTFSPTNGTELNEVGTTVVNVTYPSGSSPSTQTGGDLTTSFNVQVTEAPAQAVYTKVTSNSSLKTGDKIVLVDTARALAATKGLTPSDNQYKHYLGRDTVTVKENTVTFEPDSDICVFTLADGKIANTFALEYDSKYLAPARLGDAGLKYEASVTNASSWTIDVENATSKLGIKSNIDGQVADSLVYLMSNTDMRLYKSTSVCSPIDVYKYTSGNERVILDNVAKDVYEDKTISISATAKDFEPTTWSWETSDSSYVSIVTGSNTDTVTVKGEAVGSANVTVTANGKYKATCVVTVKDKGSMIIDEGDYFISDLTNKYIMGSDLSTVTDVDISSSENAFTFAFAGMGDNNYWITNQEGKYLTFRQNVIPDGQKVSEMILWDEPVDYWTISKNNDSYKIATSYGTKTRSIAQDNDHDWLAFEGNNYVNLSKQSTFNRIEIGHEPQYKKYDVGQKFQTTGLVVYAVFDNEFKADVTEKVTWDALKAGNKATGKVLVGGIERNVEVTGLQIFGPVPGTMEVDSLKDTYLVGEVPAKLINEVKVTYSDGVTNEERTLKTTEYSVSPDKISESTEKVVVQMVIDSTVKVEKDITVEHASYFATPLFEIGDKVTFGTTVGAKDGNITGGYEIAINEVGLTSAEFGYLPQPAMEFTVVQGVTSGSYAFEYNGSYLRSNGKTLDLGDVSTVTATKFEDLYEFDLPYDINGNNVSVHFTEDFEGAESFWGYYYNYNNYDLIQASAIIVDNVLSVEYSFYPKGAEDAIVTKQDYACEFNGTWVIYLPTSQQIGTNNSFTCEYVQSQNDFIDDYWEICPVNEPSKHMYLNTDSMKFAVSDSAGYDMMVYRDMSTNFKTAQLKSISVSVPEDMPDTVPLYGKYNWVGIKVKAVLGNTTKTLPLGAYEVDIPALDTFGPKTCTVTYGVGEYKKTGTFKIYVVGNYQPSIKQNTSEIYVDDTLHFTTTQEPPEDQPVTWSCNKPELANFEDPYVGDLTAYSTSGDDVITITVTSADGYYSDSKELHVYQRVESLSIDITSKQIEAGQSFTITPTVLPNNAKNKKCDWFSSDTDVATVNSDGVVTGLSEGTAVITCQTQGKPTGAEEPLKATCTVNVEGGTAIRVKGVSIANAPVEAKPGDKFQLSAVINPSDATDKSVTWSSNNTDLASVNKNGYVEIKNSAKTGKTVRITVKTNDGDFTASCDIKIKASITPVSVTGVTLDKTSAEIDVGKTLQLIATVKPDNATDKSVTWSSSNTSVATVSNNGVVTGVKDGEAIITVRTADGGFTATCSVTVGEGDPTVYVSGVKLNVTEKTLNVGDSFELIATVSPSNATNKDVTWESSDTNIAEVDANGKVTAKKTGEVTITVETDDGGFKATCKVKVVNKEDIDRQNIIILSSIGGGVAVVGVGCGVGIPLGVRARKRKHM